MRHGPSGGESRGPGLRVWAAGCGDRKAAAPVRARTDRALAARRRPPGGDLRRPTVCGGLGRAWPPPRPAVARAAGIGTGERRRNALGRERGKVPGRKPDAAGPDMPPRRAARAVAWATRAAQPRSGGRGCSTPTRRAQPRWARGTLAAKAALPMTSGGPQRRGGHTAARSEVQRPCAARAVGVGAARRSPGDRGGVFPPR